MTSLEKHNLYDDFLKEFPLERLRNMQLEEYSNLDASTSFCYWLESRTTELGSIWGGSSYKFGIYKRNPDSKDDTRGGYSTDGEYSWVRKYGATKEDAFEKIRNIIIEIYQAATSGDFYKIDLIDLGDAYKWKIAFLYSNKQLINIYNPDNLKIAAQHMGMQAVGKIKLSKVHGFLLEKKGDKDIFEYGDELWNLSLQHKATLPNESKAENMKEQEANILKLNTILCGPPGTGKTYKMQNEYAPLFTEKERVISKGDFSSAMIKDLTWWEVIALVLYENGKMQVKELLNHPYTRIKASYSNAKTPNNTLWGELQRRTKLDCEYVKCSTSRQEPQVFEKDKDGYWFIDKDEFVQACPNLVDIISEINDYEENTSNILHYKFITFHQKYSYEDFIIGITPTLKGEANNSGLSFELKTGVFYNCCVEALRLAGYDNFSDCYEDSKENRERKFTNARKFAIFIDEINRANISSVFGELITCIEDTKRLGRENELWVDLPLEGGMFGVPSNLYIIGTMNTADRSIALIDVALRRRFDFKRIYPDIDVFSEEKSWAKNLLGTLNRLIYEEKRSADFLIGHTYFLGKKETEKKDIFDNNIIPLLYEYFQNNTDKIQSILENCGLNVQMGKDYLLTLVSENNG